MKYIILYITMDKLQSESMEMLLFFENGSEYMKHLRNQCEVICRYTMENSFILNELDNFDFGFLRYTPIANIGRQRNRKNQINIYSFVLCKKIKVGHDIHIDICLLTSISDKCKNNYRREGSELLQLVEEYAKSINILKLELDALGEEPLKRWYERNGFTLTKTIYIQKGVPKVYHMVKLL